MNSNLLSYSNGVQFFWSSLGCSGNVNFDHDNDDHDNDDDDNSNDDDDGTILKININNIISIHGLVIEEHLAITHFNFW